MLAFTEDLERLERRRGGGGGGLDLKTSSRRRRRGRRRRGGRGARRRRLRAETRRRLAVGRRGRRRRRRNPNDGESSRGGDGSDDGTDDSTDHVGAEDNALDSTTITRLYQNKRKCEEREERRVASRLARLDTSNVVRTSSVSAAPSERLEETNDPYVAGAGAGMTWEMKRAARDQIFSSSGAFQRLYSELFALQEKTDPTCACRVDAADHDVHEWDVRFPAAAFDVFPSDGAGKRLRDDLELLEAVNGYGEVQMRVSFMPDLYPFYPPRVRVVRPRLKGIAAGALAAHPAFHLRQWRPFTPAATVVKFARDFLVRCDARVDLECDGNDPVAFPDPVHGAYADHPSRLESAARLAAAAPAAGRPSRPTPTPSPTKGFSATRGRRRSPRVWYPTSARRAAIRTRTTPRRPAGRNQRNRFRSRTKRSTRLTAAVL